MRCINADPNSYGDTYVNSDFNPYANSNINSHTYTDRNRNGRKVRKTYCFSKDWSVHQAITYFTMYSYNFCWPVRPLRVKGEGGRMTYLYVPSDPKRMPARP